MKELSVKVRVARTIQEKPYHPWSVEVEFEGATPTESGRSSVAKELLKQASAFIDEAVVQRRQEK